MITLNDCFEEREVDYFKLSLMESHLAHEVGRLTNKGFVEKYKDIDKWERELGLLNFPYLRDMLRAMVEHYSTKVGEPMEFEAINVSKYVLDCGARVIIDNMEKWENPQDYLDSIVLNALPIFMKHRLLWDEVNIAVNDHENNEQ